MLRTVTRLLALLAAFTAAPVAAPLVAPVVAIAAVSYVHSAEAQRITPSTRANVPAGSGAQSTSVTTQAASSALVAFCFYSGTSGQKVTGLTLDGQTGTELDSATNNAGGFVVLFKVPFTITGGSKTLAYTNDANFFNMDVAIEFFNAVPTYGAHGNATSGGAPGTATTSALVNTAGDKIYSAYCEDRAGGSTTPGSGQTKLDETDDGIDYIYGFTSETGTGTSDAQAITGGTPGIASIVMTFPSTQAQLLSGPTRRLLGGKVR